MSLVYRIATAAHLLIVGTAVAAAQAPRLSAPVGGMPSLLQPVAVFGTDDRSGVPSKYEAAAAKIGLLFNNQSRTVCSAFCVAENMIATAAHCINRGQGTASSRYNEFEFARNFDRAKDLVRIEGAGTGAAAQHVVAGDFKLRVRPPIDAAHDWALVRLQRNACPAGGLRVKVLSSADLITELKAGRVFQISYHRDFAQWKPAYSKPCRIARDYEKAAWGTIAPDFMNADLMLLHTCDTGGASSGSPLLLDTAEGPVVVGINVGTYVQSKVTSQQGQVVRQRSETIANTAVSAAAFGELIEPLRTATILPTGTPIRELQEQLKARNYYLEKVDGSYGPALKSAIEAYERASQLRPTGLADQTLLTRLLREPRSGTVAPSSAPEPPRPARR